jgi:hypothetical protein
MLSKKLGLSSGCVGSISFDVHDVVERLDKLIKTAPINHLQGSSDECESLYSRTDVLAMKAALKSLAWADRVLNLLVGNPNVLVGNPNVVVGNPNVVVGNPNVVVGNL